MVEGGAPWRNGFRGCKGVGNVWELDRWMYSGKTNKGGLDVDHNRGAGGECG